MAKRTDIKKILVIGSGPIVIGQAAEFDYSGTQACKALREEGYKVVIVNSNPATIMTDPDTADVVYIEPMTVDVITKIIEKEKPDAILPTMGGQTGLNLTTQLADAGVFEKYGVEVIGTPIKAIQDGEDRDKFKALIQRIGEPLPKSRSVSSVQDAKLFAKELGYPVIVRPAFTLGGTGSGIAHSEEELQKVAERGIAYSLIKQVLVEEAILGVAGWGEFEFEVMRDRNDNCIIICPMENFDPMGIHTGESIVVAPTQTLNDNDFQRLRTAAIKTIRALGIEGGCNIQFALNYETGDYRVIEVNPRVSRSSALASKATGYPIARIAAKLAVGMALDEIQNDVTKETRACFEPAIDYVVVKIPRWPFDKFRDADQKIGTQMKSTGETMAIGRTFEEAFQKAIRSLEIKRMGFGFDGNDRRIHDTDALDKQLASPTHERIFYIFNAFKLGYDVARIQKLTGINNWFLQKLKNIYDFGGRIKLEKESILQAKRLGFSDFQIAHILGNTEDAVRKFRTGNKILPTYKVVDTCAAEFRAATPYLYSTYETEDESNPKTEDKILIIGSGPIRIGQGIEFDYCCVHSVFSLRESGVKAIIINNNPETVSTDFDTSDKLYFEPLAFEDVMNVIELEKPRGVILQFGGQTPLNLATRLHNAGVKILGTSPISIDVAEDRKKFGEILDKLAIPSAKWGTANSLGEAIWTARNIGYPVLVRPSYVLGGRAMQIARNDDELMKFAREALEAGSPGHPLLIDKFLDNAIELDVDALCDGEDVFIAAIMEHVELAGIHSGDSACAIPPQTINQDVKQKVIEYTTKLAKKLNVVGLINLQFAVQNGTVYLLEANPRASRTVPYVSKTIGVPIVKVATKLILGKRLKELNLIDYKEPDFVSVKEVVFPFQKLFGVNPVLGPEMKSTGEVMAIAKDFAGAYLKAQSAANAQLPAHGNVLLWFDGKTNTNMFLQIAKELFGLGFNLHAQEDVQKLLVWNNVNAVQLSSDSEKVVEAVRNKEFDVAFVLSGLPASSSEFAAKIRRAAVDFNVPQITTYEGALASLKAIKAAKQGQAMLDSLDGYYKTAP
jgi:carbamoyl-phosphate synthase large subunit